jgi:hypothetical protein
MEKIYLDVMFCSMNQYRKIQYDPQTGEIIFEFGLRKWIRGRYINRHEKYQRQLFLHKVKYHIGHDWERTLYWIEGEKNQTIEELVVFLAKNLEEISTLRSAKSFKSDLWEGWS